MNRLRIVAAAVLLSAVALASPVLAAKSPTPKAGGSCTKSQVGRVSGTLVCSKSGSSYKWAKRRTSSSTGTTATTAAATPISSGSPSQIDIVELIIGTAPSTSSAKVDIACTGTFAAGGSETKSVTFGAAGGTNLATMSLVEPSANNATGSSCGATATVSGAVPSSLQILVNGRPQAGPVAAASVATQTFTAPGPFVVTVVASYGGSGAPAPTLAPLTPSTIAGSPTTSPGATTTTLGPTGTTPPPASGKPEIKNVLLGGVPAALAGIDAKITCTPAPGTAAFQVQTSRLGIAPGVFTPNLVLSASAQCQIEAGLAGTVDASQVSARILLNGQPISGPSLGGFINSPAFAAAQAFTATIEFTFPGSAPSTTIAGATTTTIAGATTTTVPGATTTTIGGSTTTTIPTSSSILVATSGAVPAAVTGYKVELICSNVTVNGVATASTTYTTTYGVAGGASGPLPITFGATSQCAISASTLSSSAVSVGAFTVTVNGAPKGSGTAGAASVAAFATPSAIQIRVNVAY